MTCRCKCQAYGGNCDCFFGGLTKGRLENWEETRAACVKAIRLRASYLQANGYSDASYAIVRMIALWLESDQGAEAMRHEPPADLPPEEILRWQDILGDAVNALGRDRVEKYVSEAVDPGEVRQRPLNHSPSCPVHDGRDCNCPKGAT